MSLSAGERVKDVARWAIVGGIRAVSRTRIGRFVQRQLIESAMGEHRAVSHDGLSLRFAAPNALCAWRADTFSSKEPETLEWIDGLPRGAVLWDVGANVGLYSVYAALRRSCRVFAFEPSVFNLELLARNISLNCVQDRVTIVPLALSDVRQASPMRLTTTEWGGALSTFGQSFGWDGNEIRPVFEYVTMGLSMSDAVESLGVPRPQYVKMDVDGLEHFILKGGTGILSEVAEVLIEVNDNFRDQARECAELLTEAGLSLREKRHSDLIASSAAGFDQSFNQIWVRA